MFGGLVDVVAGDFFVFLLIFDFVGCFGILVYNIYDVYKYLNDIEWDIIFINSLFGEIFMIY